MRKIIVQKFGGTSVADTEKIKNVAKTVIREKENGNDVVVVVSAMGHTTDYLVKMANEISENPSSREMDMLLSTGEGVSIALLAMALQAQGCPAVSMNAIQVGIMTEKVHSKARIIDIKTDKIKSHLAKGEVVVVAGFQGVTDDLEITRLDEKGNPVSETAVAANGKMNLQIDPNGPLCTCGQHGCLYTLANDEALVGYYHDGGGSSFQGSIAEMAAAIIKAADEGDAASRRAVERLGDVMTTAVRMISVMLDTRKVILGGPIGDSEALVRRMNDNLSSIHGVDLFPSVSRCRIKRYGSALGAVSLVVDDAFALVRDDFFSRF